MNRKLHVAAIYNKLKPSELRVHTEVSLSLKQLTTLTSQRLTDFNFCFLFSFYSPPVCIISFLYSHVGQRCPAGELEGGVEGITVTFMATTVRYHGNTRAFTACMCSCVN